MIGVRSSGGDISTVRRRGRARGFGWLLAIAQAAVWVAACSSDAPSNGMERESTDGGLGGERSSGGDTPTDGGAAVAGGPATGGASGASEAGGAPIAGGSGDASIGGAAGGSGGVMVGGAGAGGTDTCGPALEKLPLGVFTLQLENHVQRCNRDDLTCADEPNGSGVGEGTLTLVEWPGTRDGNTIYINGALSAPTLDLDGSGLHAEEYQGMLVKQSDTWAGGFDLESTATSVMLWGDNCYSELLGGVGETVVTIEMSDGQVTSFDRRCLTEYLTFFYDVRTTASGTLLCP
jgi:hypothetical protein